MNTEQKIIDRISDFIQFVDSGKTKLNNNYDFITESNRTLIPINSRLVRIIKGEFKETSIGSIIGELKMDKYFRINYYGINN